MGGSGRLLLSIASAAGMCSPRCDCAMNAKVGLFIANPGIAINCFSIASQGAHGMSAPLASMDLTAAAPVRPTGIPALL